MTIFCGFTQEEGAYIHEIRLLRKVVIFSKYR